MQMLVKTLLAFDYGTKKIGLAVGQNISFTATPLGTIKVTKGQGYWLQIDRIIQEWQPNDLLIGWPVNMDGSDSEILEKIQVFIKELQIRYSINCIKVDERLTSIIAKQTITERGVIQFDVDSMAAQIILQAWLYEVERSS
jgi:putative holliday junction resolvase